MATGRMGAANLSANTYTSVYSVPTGKTANFNVTFCNQNSGSVTVRLALSTASGTPAASDWIEYNAAVPANGVLERTGLLLAAGQCVIAWSNTANVNVVVYGMEE